jgi:hypothetical protein
MDSSEQLELIEMIQVQAAELNLAPLEPSWKTVDRDIVASSLKKLTEQSLEMEYA